MRRKLNIALGAILGIASLGWIGVERLASRTLDAEYFGLSPTRTANGLVIAPERLGGSDYCGNCHRQIFHEWNSSLHHFSSFNNAVYRRVALDVGRRRGPEVLKFCAGCHDPVALVGGELPLERLNQWSANAGITCLACHRISEVHGGNGAYTIVAPVFNATMLTDQQWLQPLHDAALAVAPALHRRAFSNPLYRTPEFCATCHSLTSPKAVNGGGDVVLQDEIGEMNRALAESNGKNNPGNCIDCHMPLVASEDPAARSGFARSHRFSGGNNAIPAWNHDDAQSAKTSSFLSTRKISVRCESILGSSCAEARAHRGRDIDVTYVVRNVGVGHAFPAGTSESNQAWVAIRVTDAAGRLVYEQDDPDMGAFRKEFVDRRGRTTDRRNTATEAVALKSSSTLNPGQARALSFRFKTSAAAVFPLTIAVKMNWRKYPAELLAWLSPESPALVAPVVVLDSVTTTLQEAKLLEPHR
ncbi:MAG TPA: multiheme c-type cytochrome [Steroidobacteraceae bacterium]|nr:multiheme c-type cytochrome [Steroidobacteraceae bacterium]